MTKTSGVSFRGKFFWVYDVVGGVFLWHLVNAAKDHMDDKPILWLDKCIEKWQLAAAITEMAFFADDEWTENQLNQIVVLSRQAVSAIRAHGDFTDDEVKSLELGDGLEIFPRGMKIIPSEPIARFGEAFISLLLDEIQAPPEWSVWFYGVENEPQIWESASNCAASWGRENLG